MAIITRKSSQGGSDVSVKAPGTRWIADPSELEFVDHGGLLIAELGVPGCQVRVLKYQAGDEIPLHYHTKDNVKAVLRGSISFEDENGPIGHAKDGTIYWCGMGPYRGVALTESYLLVVEESGSERVNVN